MSVLDSEYVRATLWAYNRRNGHPNGSNNWC